LRGERRLTAMRSVTNIADLREIAMRRLPSIISTYIENGGYEEETLRRNRSELAREALVPHILNDVSERSMKTTLAGYAANMPLGLAPVGACGLTYPNGEIEAARAAEANRVPFCLSTLSISTIEDVARATRAPFWFQLYMMRDKGINAELLRRAKDAGCSALVLSLDLHVRSQRHGEQRHGLGAPPRIDLANIWDAISHPRWLLSMIRSRRRTFGNLIGLVPDAANLGKITCWLEEQFDATLSTKDIDWARELWPGKLIVKGVLHPADAQQCFDHGVDAIVVSNHGGRQVDGAVSTVEVLPRIADAVHGRGQILVDSGIRSGIDVLKMLARGADGCLIGRAFLYGLAAGGREGVERALEIIRDELDQTMALCGLTDLRRLPSDLLVSAQSTGFRLI
jgi:L-lactate dehydrogenase (cytochrome)